MTPWKPHTVTPAPSTCAIIAARYQHAGPYSLLPDLYIYTDGKWMREIDYLPLADPLQPEIEEYWWCAEIDLLAHLATLAASHRNGHSITPEPVTPPPAEPNHLAAGKYGDTQTYIVSAADRITRVKTFTRDQCRAALMLPDLQTTVERAVLTRMVKLDQQDKMAQAAQAAQRATQP
jgi:hypothetical protein